MECSKSRFMRPLMMRAGWEAIPDEARESLRARELRYGVIVREPMQATAVFIDGEERREWVLGALLWPTAERADLFRTPIQVYSRTPVLPGESSEALVPEWAAFVLDLAGVLEAKGAPNDA